MDHITLKTYDEPMMPIIKCMPKQYNIVNVVKESKRSKIR